MAFMLPGYTGEEIRKMQDGRLLPEHVKLFIFSQIFDRRDTGFGGRRGPRIPALEAARDL